MDEEIRHPPSAPPHHAVVQATEDLVLSPPPEEIEPRPECRYGPRGRHLCYTSDVIPKGATGRISVGKHVTRVLWDAAVTRRWTWVRRFESNHPPGFLPLYDACHFYPRFADQIIRVPVTHGRPGWVMCCNPTGNPRFAARESEITCLRCFKMGKAWAASEPSRREWREKMGRTAHLA